MFTCSYMYIYLFVRVYLPVWTCMFDCSYMYVYLFVTNVSSNNVSSVYPEHINYTPDALFSPPPLSVFLEGCYNQYLAP